MELMGVVVAGHRQGLRLTLGVPKWACLGVKGGKWKTRWEASRGTQVGTKDWSGPLGGPTGA